MEWEKGRARRRSPRACTPVCLSRILAVTTVARARNGRREELLVLLQQHDHRRWCFLSWWLRLMPPPLRNTAHALVARHRYASFGRSDACKLPLPNDSSGVRGGFERGGSLMAG